MVQINQARSSLQMARDLFYDCGEENPYQSLVAQFRKPRSNSLLNENEEQTMKKIILTAAAASLISTPAFAQSANDAQDFVINANVEQECSLENPADFTLGALPINTDPGPDALLLTAQVEDDQNIWMSCNYAADITLAADNRRLTNANPVTDTAQFTNELNYRIWLEPNVAGAFNGFSSFIPAFQGPATSFRTQNSEFHDNASLRVAVPLDAGNTNKRPIAGDYTDTVTITLGTL